MKKEKAKPYIKKQEPTEADKKIKSCSNDLSKCAAAIERRVRQLYISSKTLELLPEGPTRVVEEAHFRAEQQKLAATLDDYEQTWSTFSELLCKYENERVVTAAWVNTYPDALIKLRLTVGKVIGCPTIY